MKKKTGLVFLLCVLLMSAVFSISIFADDGDSSGAYSANEIEPNDNAPSATPISFNSAVSGNLSGSFDMDWYVIELEQDGYISISFKHDKMSDNDDYWRIRVYQSDGITYYNNIATNYTVAGDADRKLPDMGLAAGVYYIRVAKGDYDYSTSTYELTVNYTESDRFETEINNTKDTADKVEFNSEYQGSISANDDVDWYRIDLERDGYISIVFNHAQISDNDDYWRIQIYKSDGITYYNNVATNYTVVGNANRTLPDMGLAAGTYYIMIWRGDYDYSTSTYNLTVNYTESDRFETEINNTKDTADKVEFNTKYQGSLSASGDVDWYKIELERDGYISIVFNHVQISDDDDYWGIQIYQSDGVTYYNNNSTYYIVNGNADRILPDMGLPAGVYYIRIAKGDYDYSTSTYNLTVNYTESTRFETESNGSKESADIIELNSEYQGSISSSGDKDWYKITFSYSTVASIIFNHKIISDTDDYWRIYLYKSDGYNVYGSNSVYYVAGNKNAELADIQFSAGTYYLKVEKGDYDYSISTYSLTVLEKHDCVAGDWEISAEPTCTEEGTRVKVCTKCKKVLSTEAVPALGHTSDNWTVVNEATCTEAGYRKGICARCGESVDETLKMLSHECSEFEVISGNKLIPPIIKERRCSLCGESERISDWSNVWITVLAAVGVIGVVIGLISYIKAFKKK